MLAEREDRISALAGHLVQGDPAQIAFQTSEIAGDLVYLRHGIEVRPGDLVIDAGGNLGATAAFFATQCGARVHSFEPVPATFAQLEANLADIEGCTSHPFGLAREAGTRRMFTYGGGDSVLSGIDAEPERIRELLAIAGRNLGLSEERAQEMAAERCVPREVECRFETLSGFISVRGIERVDLLKIDVEGAEADLLRGIAAPDWGRIAQIAAEIHSDELLAEVSAILAENSFRVFTEQSPELAGTPVRFLYARR
mgnify:CR=1 FL=1